MDLLLIARKLWRYKLATLPVIFLIICGVGYVVAVKDPLYQASSSYLLINPPAAPTADQIARTPALGKIHADNPYTRFADQSVVIDVLSRSVSSESARRVLVRAGADRRYTVASAASFGASSPIVQITGTGTTPQAAIRTANVVSHAVVGELDRMQKTRNVDQEYRITAMQVESPSEPELRASGQLRMLVGVLVLGAVLLFVMISVLDGLESLRRERQAARSEFAVQPDPLTFDASPDLEGGFPSNGRGEPLPSLHEERRSNA